MITPLNPDAFLAAKDAGREAIQAEEDLHDVTTAMLSAYLAAELPETRCVERHSPDLVCDGCEPPTPALPEVTSVEELEALPAKTVILDSHGEVSVITETGRFMCDDGECYYLDEVADDLPARVLYSPEGN